MVFNNLKRRLIRFSDTYHFKYGIPLIIFSLIGPFFLKELQQIRYDYRKFKAIPESNSEILKKYSGGATKITIEAEELIDEANSVAQGSYENIRGPRPWEEEENPQGVNNKKIKRFY